MKIQKAMQTETGECLTEAGIEHAANGLTTITVSATIDGHRHEHRVTVGASDGKDRLRDMNDEQLTEMLQKHLDEVRSECAEILKSRIRVKNLTAKLL